MGVVDRIEIQVTRESCRKRRVLRRFKNYKNEAPMESNQVTVSGRHSFGGNSGKKTKQLSVHVWKVLWKKKT